MEKNENTIEMVRVVKVEAKGITMAVGKVEKERPEKEKEKERERVKAKEAKEAKAREEGHLLSPRLKLKWLCCAR